MVLLRLITDGPTDKSSGLLPSIWMVLLLMDSPTDKNPPDSGLRINPADVGLRTTDKSCGLRTADPGPFLSLALRTGSCRSFLPFNNQSFGPKNRRRRFKPEREGFLLEPPWIRSLRHSREVPAHYAVSLTKTFDFL